MKNRRLDDGCYRRRRLLIFVMISFLCLSIIYNFYAIKFFMFHRSEIQEKSAFDVALSAWQKEDPTCRPPSHIDPHDPIVSYYLHSVSLTCERQIPLTVLDQETGLLTHVASESHTCYYSFFRKEDEADNYINYEKTMKFNQTPVQMTNNYNLVNTSCIDNNQTKFYLNTHLFVPKFKSHQQSSPDKPSVFIFFLESLPQLSFKRFMKKTKRALDDLQHVQYFNYFVKPLDNSFPNTVALLTGERVTWEEEKVLKKDFFDAKFKYLWDEFKEAGYVTAFEEDFALVGVFNYGKLGFKTSPCDFNPRSFWVQMYPESGDFDINRAMNDQKEYCFHKNGPKIKLFFDHARQFMSKNQHNPYFSFYFFSQMTHQNFNSYKMADPYVAEFFSSIKHLLNNTILIFAGDHGFRMGSFVPTSMGRVEERMNLVSIRIPEAVDSKYPHLRRLLDANSDSLVTWYDIHIMLQSVANGQFKETDLTAQSIGPVNPMRQLVPKSRTCRDANIDDIYCVCNDVVNVDPNGGYKTYDVVPAMRSVQRFIDMNWRTRSCAQKVNKTMRFSYHIPRPGEQFIPIERGNITVLLKPSNITFATKVVRMWNKKFDFEVDEKDHQSVKQLLKRIHATCKTFN